MSAGESPSAHGTGRPAAEFALDVDRVRALLADQHPDLADLALEPVATGWDNAMFRLGDRRAVRLPRRRPAAELIERELKWLPRLAPSLPLPVPAPLRVGRPACGYPWPWAVVPWLRGTTADRTPLPDDDAGTLMRFLDALHRPAPADAPTATVRGVALSEREATVRRRLARLADRSVLVPAPARKLWLRSLRSPIRDRPTWIHGDLHPRNVLVDRGRLAGILDWGDLCAGDPATDLASIWLLLDSAPARAEAMSLRDSATEETWLRARGWAFTLGVLLLSTGADADGGFAACGAATLARLHDDR